MAQYKDRSGNRISEKVWVQLQADHSYCQIRSFENDRVQVFLYWDGKTNQKHAPIEYWNVYALSIHNRVIDENGIPLWVPDPASTRFYDEKMAIEGFEKFVARWTESYYETVQGEDGKSKQVLVEVGNKLAPPPKWQPKQAENQDDDGFTGSW